MPGYVLMQQASLQPYKPKGIPPAPQIIGILDFLRELEQDPFPFAKMSKWQVVGLEEVLFAARPNEQEVAIDIHTRLNRAASGLEKHVLDVQIVFSGEIVRGADTTVKYRGALLPINLIFNHPPIEKDANGNVFFRMEFHLSSP